jgi:hypothetical protein
MGNRKTFRDVTKTKPTREQKAKAEADARRDTARFKVRDVWRTATRYHDDDQDSGTLIPLTVGAASKHYNGPMERWLLTCDGMITRGELEMITGYPVPKYLHVEDVPEWDELTSKERYAASYDIKPKGGF